MAIRGFWVVVAGIGVFLLIGPVINPPLTLQDITSSASTVTERWIARDFSAEYTVSVADDGRLVTTVEERITAFFPEDVDEDSIERVIATDYQGHDLRPSNISATLDGAPIDLERDVEAGRSTLTLTADERLQGDHDVVLKYTLHDLAYETNDRSSGEPVQLLEWDIFGPSWPHGLAAVSVRVSVDQTLNDALIRQPRGVLAWTILSDGSWLEPEGPQRPGFTTYEFTNEQNIPPYANAVFTMAFTPGTIVMPQPSTLFWVQTFGPLVPLAALAVTLLFAIAARRIAWSDARGEDWYVPQYEPPKKVSVQRAAHILRSVRATELASVLHSLPHGTTSAVQRRELLTAGVIAKRSGRLGNLPRALAFYGRHIERTLQLTDGIRRVPVGFVRDAFIAAPIALTLVQWGIVRQLSHHTILSVVWWPVAFVLLSTAIAIVIIAIALRARPLTEKGALIKQHLLGLGNYAESTQLLHRGNLSDAALPYAVLLAPAREAGEAISERIEVELGERIPTRSWRNGDFLTPARLAVRGVAVILVVGVFVLINLVPNAFERSPDPVAYSGDVAGSYGAQVTGFSAAAELRRDTTDHAVIEASERLTVTFSDDGSSPPQLVRQWPEMAEGQNLHVTVRRVFFDGEPIPFVVESTGGGLLMRTTMANAIAGERTVHIDYTISSAAIAMESDGQIVDRVRWAALIDGWEYTYGNDDRVVDPLRVEFSMSEELAAEAITSGWITVDRQSGTPSSLRPDGVVEFDAVTAESDTDTTVDSTTLEAATIEHTLSLGVNENGSYPYAFTLRDLGVLIDFPAGTFAGPDLDALQAKKFTFVWPVALTVVLGLLTLIVSLLGLGIFARRGMPTMPSHALRDVYRWTLPAMGLTTFILFVWVTTDLSGSHPAFAPTGLSAIAALIGAGLALWVGWRKGPVG